MQPFCYDAKEVAHVTGGILYRTSPRPLTSAVIDTKKVEENAVFFPFLGSHTDGHRFIPDAVRRGASAVFFLKGHLDPCALPDGDYSAIGVSDMQAALEAFARHHRTRHRGIRLAVTGSVGKTSTKELLRAMLSACAPTYATTGNYNNALGVPLTLLSIPVDAPYAVLELGMSARGEISSLARLVCPHYGIITNVGTSHIEYLGSREQIAQAKLELLDALPDPSRLICNADEPLLVVPDSIRVGRTQGDYRMCDYGVTERGCHFTLLCPDGEALSLALPAQGTHLAFDAALAFGCADQLGLPRKNLAQGLCHFQNAAMRQELHVLRHYTVIEDCYNASPESMCAALSHLCEYAHQKGQRPIAVLGDILELGAHSPALHARVGAFAATLPLSALYTFGKASAAIASAAQAHGATFPCFTEIENNIENLYSIMKKTLQKEDVILLKASRGMQLERIFPFLESE